MAWKTPNSSESALRKFRRFLTNEHGVLLPPPKRRSLEGAGLLVSHKKRVFVGKPFG